jgi:hypothetical protein
MRHATALLSHVCAVASLKIRFASCGTSGKLTLWTRYVYVMHNLLNVLVQIANKMGFKKNTNLRMLCAVDMVAGEEHKWLQVERKFVRK